MKKFVADFETCTWKDDETYVWAYATCDIDNPENVTIGNNIDDFMLWCEKNKNSKVAFHNLKFDGEFILYYLETHGFTFIENKKDKKDKTYTTLITKEGQFFSITVYFKTGNKKDIKVDFFDSLKILPFSIKKIAESFKLPISKLELEYTKEREKNHVLTSSEIDYITNDVKIPALALKVLYDQKLNKLTSASNALSNYKDIIKLNKFNHLFPELECDEFIRHSYKGGFTYLNPKYKEKQVNEGIVLDVNSLYPSIMAGDNLIPVCKPKYFKGKYIEDKIYNLYVQHFFCSFELKKGKLPTLQIKNSIAFMPNAYLTTSNLKIVELYMTNVDLELFKEHYDIFDIEYVDGYKFRSLPGKELFGEYVEKWTENKIKAKKER